MHTNANNSNEKLLLVAMLAENYGKEMSKELSAFWLLFLQPYSLEVVEKAITKVMIDYEYKTIPPIAVMKKALDFVLAQDTQSTEFLALSQWTKLLEQVRAVGSYGSPELDETTRQVVRIMGGWNAICQWQEKDLSYKEKRFLELWHSVYEKEDMLFLEPSEIKKLLQEKARKDTKVLFQKCVKSVNNAINA